jgi:pimeloyl-ACP methyl ester carboxylesterase
MGTIMKTIILHGWTYSLERWQKFLELLEKKEIEPIMLNLPGLTSKNDQVWDMEDYVNWLKEIVDKEKNKVVLIGHSTGGRIAINFVIKYPEKVEKLILIDSAGIYHNELPLALKRVIFKTLAKFGKILRGSSILRDILYKLTGESDYKDASPNMKRTMLNLINSDKALKLEKVRTPTLIFWGKEDKITPLSDGKLIHSIIKNSRLEIIENARHAPQFTNPKQIAEIIYEYL